MTGALEIGDVVVTNYNTGPYRIIEIEGGCKCSSYLQTLNGKPKERPPHLHIVCVDERVPVGKERRSDFCYLNGYVVTAGGRIVCVSKPHDELTVLRKAVGIQLGLSL